MPVDAEETGAASC